MKAVLIRFLIWAAACTAEYYTGKYFGWSNWWFVIFAFGSLAIYLVIAAVFGKKPTLNQKASQYNESSII